MCFLVFSVHSAAGFSEHVRVPLSCVMFPDPSASAMQIACSICEENPADVLCEQCNVYLCTVNEGGCDKKSNIHKQNEQLTEYFTY